MDEYDFDNEFEIDERNHTFLADEVDPSCDPMLCVDCIWPLEPCQKKGE